MVIIIDILWLCGYAKMVIPKSLYCYNMFTMKKFCQWNYGNRVEQLIMACVVRGIVYFGWLCVTAVVVSVYDVADFTQKRLQREAEERAKQEEKRRQAEAEKQRRRESLNNHMPGMYFGNQAPPPPTPQSSSSSSPPVSSVVVSAGWQSLADRPLASMWLLQPLSDLQHHAPGTIHIHFCFCIYDYMPYISSVCLSVCLPWVSFLFFLLIIYVIPYFWREKKILVEAFDWKFCLFV